jgi:HSP20 family protein
MEALRPWRPLRDLERLTREVEEHFPNIFGRWPFEETRSRFLPVMESYVQDGNLIVRTDLPGIDPKEIEISVLGNILTIKGERKRKEEVKSEDYVRREVSYGSFERRMTLPEGAATDKIKAHFEDGVVEIAMPMAKEIGARKIPLEVETGKNGQKEARN